MGLRSGIKSEIKCEIKCEIQCEMRECNLVRDPRQGSMRDFGPDSKKV